MIKYWEKSGDISYECAKTAYETIVTIDPYLKKFEVIDNQLTYPIKRVCRLSELVAIDIVRQYGVTLSRIGHPFDFLNQKWNSDINMLELLLAYIQYPRKDSFLKVFAFKLLKMIYVNNEKCKGIKFQKGEK